MIVLCPICNIIVHIYIPIAYISMSSLIVHPRNQLNFKAFFKLTFSAFTTLPLATPLTDPPSECMSDSDEDWKAKAFKTKISWKNALLSLFNLSSIFFLFAQMFNVIFSLKDFLFLKTWKILHSAINSLPTKASILKATSFPVELREVFFSDVEALIFFSERLGESTEGRNIIIGVTKYPRGTVGNGWLPALLIIAPALSSGVWGCLQHCAKCFCWNITSPRCSHSRGKSKFAKTRENGSIWAGRVLILNSYLTEIETFPHIKWFAYVLSFRMILMTS